MNGRRIPEQKHREEAAGCEGDSPVLEISCQGLIFPREMKHLYNYNTRTKLTYFDLFNHLIILLLELEG